MGRKGLGKLSDSDVKRAYAEYYRNKRRVLDGETFKGRQDAYKRGKSPGSCKPFV